MLTLSDSIANYRDLHERAYTMLYDIEQKFHEASTACAIAQKTMNEAIEAYEHAKGLYIERYEAIESQRRRIADLERAIGQQVLEAKPGAVVGG